MNKLVAFIGLSFLAASTFAAMDSAAPSDPEIAQIMLSTNKVEIAAGKLAKKKTDNAEVREFAEMMINEHSSVTDQTKELANKIKLKPKNSVASTTLEKDATRAEKKLKGLKGGAFDTAYVNQMVAGHQAVLDSIDTKLIPNAKNEELKGLLTKVRPAVEMHLQHAKTLQAKLAAANGAG